MGNTIDIMGKKFGRLTVIKREYPNRNRTAMWLCKCDCGKKKIIRGSALRNGQTKSCGCLRKEISSKKMKDNPIGKIGARRLIQGLSSFRETIASYRRRAKIRGLDFELTQEQFEKLTQKDCYYCGVKPNQKKKNSCNNGDYIYNGIDRVDNTKGYTIDNVVPCCGFCNMAKRNHTEQEFKDWVKKIYNNLWF